MADTEINDSAELSVADMMGQVEPAAVSDFEAGKVELSVPRKYVPVKKKPKKQPVAKPKPPLGKAVPVFRTETYVDDDGIEHMMPPSYDKSNMNLPQAKFKRPENMSMIRDDEVVAEQIRQEEAQKTAQEETPDFIREWQKSSSDVDNEVNDILDDDGAVDLAVEGEEDEPLAPAVSAEAENSPVMSENDIHISAQEAHDNPSELLGAEEDADLDMEQIDKLLAEQSAAEPKEEVLGLNIDDLLSEGEQRDAAEEQHVIPKFEVEEEEATALPMLEAEPLKEITEEKIPEIEAEPIVEPESEELPIAKAEPIVEPEAVVAEETVIDEAEPEKMPSVEAQNEEPRAIELEPSAFSALAEKIDDVLPVDNMPSSQQQVDEASLFVRQYSGHLDDSYFVVSAKNLPEEFIGTVSQNSIQINVGTSDYGWSVLFANGILMGIADVRMFQLKHGKLPETGGMLMYGTKKMKFSEVERIVLYQSPQYFSYV